MTPGGRRWAVTAGLAGVLLLAGCGGLSDDEVGRVAAEFAAGGPAERCELLAAPTHAAFVEARSSTCEEAVEQVPVGSGELTEVQVWGEEAQVRLSDDTLFLTRTSAGWRVVAAACRPGNPGGPYECQVENG